MGKIIYNGKFKQVTYGDHTFNRGESYDLSPELAEKFLKIKGFSREAAPQKVPVFKKVAKKK